MPFEIVTVPCRSDNYAYLIRHDGGRCAVVDVPEAGPIRNALGERGWDLHEIWITHHHADHVDGVAELREATGAMVRGASADVERLPPLDAAHADGESFDFAGAAVTVMDVSGHTVGHIAFHMPDADAAFTADSLMAFGCGRVFEGSMDQMWASLTRLAELPPATMVYSGHEYTQKNANFARTIEPGNDALTRRADAVDAARDRGEITVPVRLDEELATNPFLRAASMSVKEALSMRGDDDVAVFAEIRRRRDSF